MAETGIPRPSPSPSPRQIPARMMIALWHRIDTAWTLNVGILLAVLVLAPADFPVTLRISATAFGQTAPFILFAVLAVGALKASGAETALAKVFQGRQNRMIVMAALLGGLAPFCSCEVIPFIAAMLSVGAPLSAVMAFWLSSPLMDPAMFLITAGAIGLNFAIAKTVAAVALGLFGGFGVRALGGTGLFDDPLKIALAPSCGCGATVPGTQPVWRFWQVEDRRAVFWKTAWANTLFLTKWLVMAYILEALMVRYVPAGWIASTLGGSGAMPIFLGALVGGPAYLNGYAAVPLIGGLLDQGMSAGAAMSFVLAGGVSSIPAAIAVWALVRPRVFAAYLGFALIGSLVAGFVWAALQ